MIVAVSVRLSVVHAQVAVPEVIAFVEHPVMEVSVPLTVCLNVTVPTAPAGVTVAERLLGVFLADDDGGELKAMLVLLCVTGTDIGDALDVP